VAVALDGAVESIDPGAKFAPGDSSSMEHLFGQAGECGA
jgi:hypothetical protein